MNKLSHLSKKKENKQLIRDHLLSYPKDEHLDIIYELAYEIQEGKTLQDVFQQLKKAKFGLQHQDFNDISEKIKETDNFMNNNFESVEGVNECSKCKSKRTISFTKQVRSADEGTSVFITCIDCKYRFILSS